MKEPKRKLTNTETMAKASVLEQLKKEMSDMMTTKMSEHKNASNTEGEDHGVTSADHIIKNDDHYSDDDSNVEGAEEDLGEDLDHDHEEGEPAAHLKAMQSMHDGDTERHQSNAQLSEDELDKKIKDLLQKKKNKG